MSCASAPVQAGILDNPIPGLGDGTALSRINNDPD